jgi:hypothetical protein
MDIRKRMVTTPIIRLWNYTFDSQSEVAEGAGRIVPQESLSISVKIFRN